MNSRASNILVVDVGGTHIKFLATGQKEVVKFPSGPKMTPTLMVETLRKLIGKFNFTGVSMGYPGPVVDGKPAAEPHNLAPGWIKFDYKRAFGCPVKIINDAAMQALGSYEGGRMLFLGLGTGLGSALMIDGVLAALELAHLPYREGTFEDYVGLRGLERLGKRKWRIRVVDVITRLKAALVADYVVLGGGNAKLLKELPVGVRLGENVHAFVGGQRLWERSA
jgi:predicted NBD/HSP70 family sugar kinase